LQPPEVTTRSPRGSWAQAITAAAREILETDGYDTLTMRRLADAVGIRAPSLYKHFPDRAAAELALIEVAFEEAAEAIGVALKRDGATLIALGRAYRSYAVAHPELYQLMTRGPLDRERLQPGLEARAAEPLNRVVRDPDLARAAWAFAHGMTILELDGRFPATADLDAAWAAGLAAFSASSTNDSADTS
jgi:AcrR family transcriptional regulator